MNRAVTILVVILILIVIATGATFWLLPSAPSQPPVSSSPAADEAPLFSDSAAPVATSAPAGPVFNVDVLSNTLYQSLNHQLIDNGSLPVQPPAATGKANPFL